MNREQKVVAIAEIAANIDEAHAILAIDYRGISVPQIAELRAGLRDADATFKVVKNSLTERAADLSGAEVLKPLLTGPTALAFVRGDVAAAAKAIADYGRTTQLLAFKGGLMDGAALDAEQIRALSRLPSRQVLYGQMVGVVASPVSGLVRGLGALLGGLAVALAQVRDKMESGEIAAGAPSELPPAGDAEPEAAAELEAPAEGEAAAEPETVTEREQPAAADEESPQAQAAQDQTELAQEPAQQDDETAASSEASPDAGAETAKEEQTSNGN